MSAEETTIYLQIRQPEGEHTTREDFTELDKALTLKRDLVKELIAQSRLWNGERRLRIRFTVITTSENIRLIILSTIAGDHIISTRPIHRDNKKTIVTGEMYAATPTEYNNNQKVEVDFSTAGGFTGDDGHKLKQDDQIDFFENSSQGQNLIRELINLFQRLIKETNITPQEWQPDARRSPSGRTPAVALLP